MKILITGTPGVGKTTASRLISLKTGIEHIDVTKYIKEKSLFLSYDERLDTLIFDEDIVREDIKKYLELKESFIIDTHSPVVVSEIKFDYVFHIICDTSVLWQRQEARNYSHEKISENIESEIFNVIGEEIDDYFEIEKYLINGSEIPLEDAEYFIKDIYNIIHKETSNN